MRRCPGIGAKHDTPAEKQWTFGFIRGRLGIEWKWQKSYENAIAAVVKPGTTVLADPWKGATRGLALRARS
jgi:hypothetical protein